MNNDNTYDCVEIYDCDKSATSVEIPSEIEDLPVTSIGKGAFSDCTELENIIIPDSVINIGDDAFLNCIKLPKYVEIPENIVTIGKHAFGYLTYIYNDLTHLDKIDNFVIYGVSGKAGEVYALNHGMTFIDVNKPVSVSSKEFTLSIGSSQIVTVDNYAGEVEWYSDNEEVATVSGGYVRAVSNGTANIYAIAGDEKFAIPVTVSDDPSATEPSVTTVVSGTTTDVSVTQTTVSTDVTSAETTVTTESTDVSDGLKGDANNDGKVNVCDCAFIAKALAKGEGDTLPSNADYSDDGKINVRDAAAIASALAKGEIK